MRITTSKGRVLLEREGELAGADLRDLKLSGAYPNGQSLVGTDLSESVLTMANLEDADLSKSAARRRNPWKGVDCDGARFDGADLRGAD